MVVLLDPHVVFCQLLHSWLSISPFAEVWSTVFGVPNAPLVKNGHAVPVLHLSQLEPRL